LGIGVEGEWKTDGLPLDREGRFVRSKTTFRGRVTADGSSGFPAEAGRYHLYVSWACRLRGCWLYTALLWVGTKACGSWRSAAARGCPCCSGA
jgi:glutathionyl-hydroquinone reductase